MCEFFASNIYNYVFKNFSRATVCGHTMAVTSVDWREDGCGLSVLATCSDDRVCCVVSYKCYFVWFESSDGCIDHLHA